MADGVGTVATGEKDELSADGDEPGADEPTGRVPPDDDVDLDAWEEDHSTEAGDEALTPGGGRRGFVAEDPSTYRSGRTLGDIAGLGQMNFVPGFRGVLDGILGQQQRSVAAMVMPALSQWQKPGSAYLNFAERMAEDRARMITGGATSAAASLVRATPPGGWLPKSTLSAAAMIPRQPSAVDAFRHMMTGPSGLDSAASGTMGLINAQLAPSGIAGANNILAGIVGDFARQASPLLVDMATAQAPALASIQTVLRNADFGAAAGLRNTSAALAFAAPRFDPGFFALQGVNGFLRNVPPGTWDEVDEDDVAGAVAFDLEHSLTDPDPQTLQRVLAAEQRQELLDAHFHPFVSLDETLQVLGFDAKARERLAPVLASTAGAFIFLLALLDHYTGSHVRAIKDAGDAASKTYGRVDDWARGK